jgi:putative tryptophan/tyrosine transport system substrate-binding protein
MTTQTVGRLQIYENAVNCLIEIFRVCSLSTSLVAVLFFVAPLLAEAQPAGTVHRIGFLGNSTPALEANLVGPFREGLRELGYVEGRNILIEYRWAEGKYERLAALVAELLARNVEVIVTAGTPASHAVKKATNSVPLVMVAVGDPVASGLVPSVTRPGGNITGLTSMGDELEGKRLELLRDLIPTISHVAALTNSGNASMKKASEVLLAVAAALKIKVMVFDVRSADQLEKAFDVMRQKRPDALLVPADRVFLNNRARIVEFAAQQRLPGIHGYRELVEAGGLISYGPSYEGMHRRAAYYVDRILKGTRPGDLPIEGPTTFDLVINMNTAKTLGLTIPPALLLRANQVIE